MPLDTIGPPLVASALPAPQKGRGGRPKHPPGSVRTSTIGVRVSPAEYAALKLKAVQMGLTPAQWLREAALSKRLPSAPVPVINREQYSELARLAANLNQLAKGANEQRQVTVSDALLQQLSNEVKRLRLGLLGKESDDDR